ncbi:MAG: HlyC/CorC family transporter [Deltaproteobacteria bacterium]|nr:HlyC/CorC family transporter [Deltaproteobacteria bacterium]MBN2672633.1 HlyC/CorC family transporter [Deltaproteobacteria bacterium]
MDDGSSTLFELIGIGVCLLLSAFFSSSETTLTSISTTRAHLLMLESPSKYDILKVWLASKKRILAALLIGNNLVNILCSILAYRLAFRYAPNWAEAISVFGLTLVVLIFAEITPKSLAIHHAEKIVVPVMRTVWLVDKLLFVLAWPLAKLPGLLSKNHAFDDGEPIPTEDEIKYHIKRGLDKEVFDDSNQGELLANTIEFTMTMVKEIMIPRTEMVGLDQESTLEAALDSIIESGHSRLPVFDQNPDNIVGILYAKDLLTCMRKKDYPTENLVKNITRKDTFYAPETQKISELLTDMRRRSSHMAIVVDEFGGTAGIITLEDIIEELVGEIHDEHDQDEPELRKLEENRWEVNAHMAIPDFEDETGLTLPDSGDYETVGGVIVTAFGRIPKRGKSIRIGLLNVTVTDADIRHIKRVEIRLDPEDAVSN